MLLQNKKKITYFVKNYIFRILDRKLGPALRERYTAYHVTRPYNIHVSFNGMLKGQVAVVTGGSGAIGRACAVRLAVEGAKVYVCGTREANVSLVVKEIRDMGYLAEPVILDVTDADKIEKSFKEIASANDGSIDILVNSAGGSARSHASNIVNQNVEIIDNLLNVNLRGTMLCAKYASLYMIKNRRGRIVNITSVIGLQGKAGFSEYAASKGGSIAFVKSLAQELGRYNITVNGVAPGIVQRGVVTGDMIAHLSATNWMGTYGKPEDISAMVNFLCSDEASFITGQNIAVDGGRSLGLKEV